MKNKEGITWLEWKKANEMESIHGEKGGSRYADYEVIVVRRGRWEYFYKVAADWHAHHYNDGLTQMRRQDVAYDVYFNHARLNFDYYEEC